MGQNTHISWAHHTFNPWIGCTKVGPGCDNCYAEARDGRFHWTPEGWGAGKPRHRTRPENWKEPIKWNGKCAEARRRDRVFAASMADIFDNEIDPAWRADLFALIRETPHLDWLLLTKRVGNVAKMLPDDWGFGYQNVWLGATVVNQEEADRDIEKLIKLRAVCRFLSIEPMLEPIELRFNGGLSVDWIIVGAESGPRGRSFDLNWVRNIRQTVIWPAPRRRVSEYFRADTRPNLFFKQIIVSGNKVETPWLDTRRWEEVPLPKQGDSDDV